MTLDEAFEKYDDTVILRRKSFLSRFKNPTQETIDYFTNESSFFKYDIKWLKQLKAWGNEESRKMGFFIPQTMIDDANADDWELVE